MKNAVRRTDLTNDDEGRPRSENDAACGTRLICVHSPDCATPAAAAAHSPKIRDLGFFNPYQIMLSGEKYFKSQKNPTPGLRHRRHCCCAEPEYQLHT